jgi:probable HAF family extracellular repeat protein
MSLMYSGGGGGSPLSQDSQTPVGQNYALIGLGNLGGSFSDALGINAAGQIVGYADDPTSGSGHAFLYTNGVMTDIGTLGGDSAQATGINDKGQIVGYSYTVDDIAWHAFLYSGGSMQDLGVLGGGIYASSYAYGINNSSQITGYSDTATYYSHAFIYSNNVMHDIGTSGGNSSYGLAINASGQVVGQSFTIGDASLHAFWYANGSMNDLGTLGGGSVSSAYGINAGSTIVGYSGTNNNGNISHAILYSEGAMEDIGALNGKVATAYGINGSGQIVGSTRVMNDYRYHAFLYSGGVMQDLNSLAIPTNSGWVLQQANAINDAGQIVGSGLNPSGQQEAFLLNPLLNGALEACTNTQTSLPTYGTIPLPEGNQDSLIVITHGWIRLNEDPVTSSAWVDSMSNSIAQYLTVKGLNNWRVYGYKWIDKAHTLTPVGALANGIQQGNIVGESIIQGGWSHVHFIAHSAGAGLIQSATEEIRGASLLLPAPVIHSTFLDPYDGTFLEYSFVWGEGADWADSYFSRDLLTGATTQQPLMHAFNTDVTTLDPQASSNQIPNFVSSGSVNGPCYKTESNHSWPISFYSNSISSSVFPSYLSFGFSLSEEGGNWNAVSQCIPGNGFMGNGQVNILGPEDPNCIPYVFSPAVLGNGINFLGSSTLESTTGTIEKFINSLKLTSGSPVWIAKVITDIDTLNSVVFDAEFTSASGAHGLLSIYWDTNMIGLIDEGAVLPGIQRYTLSFPNAVANSSHIFGIHLDPFTEVHSSIVITNVVFGFAGVSQQPVLTVTTNTNGGLLVYQLSGQNATYSIQVNSDLTSTNWVDIALLSNTNGIVNFVDQNSVNYPCRFYRAVAQQ